MKHIQTLLVHNRLLLLLAVSWTVLITYLCLEESSDFSSIAISNIDKLAHFSFYFILTLLWFFYMIWNRNPEKALKKGILILLISVFYGIFIEWAQQTFTKSRQADVFDVFANLAGSIMATIASFWLMRKLKKFKKHPI